MNFDEFFNKNGNIDSNKIKTKKDIILNLSKFINDTDPNLPLGSRVRILSQGFNYWPKCDCGKYLAINKSKGNIFKKTCGSSACHSLTKNRNITKVRGKLKISDKISLLSEEYIHKWIKENINYINDNSVSIKSLEYQWLRNYRKTTKNRISQYCYDVVKGPSVCSVEGCENKRKFISYEKGYSDFLYCNKHKSFGTKNSRKNNKLREIKSYFKDKGYELISETGINEGPSIFVHNKCGKTFTAWTNNGRKSISCKYCFPFITSSYETKIKEYIESLGFNTIQSYKITSSNKEIDIFVPNKNIGIEINGIYWHSKKDDSEQFRHLEKRKISNNLGIDLLQFTDVEIDKSEDIVKSIIKNRLGLSTKIYARKCYIKNVIHKEYEIFCEQNHLHGYANASIIKGLYFQNELVMIISLSKDRFSKSNNLELIRMVTKLNHIVIGGLSKLLKTINEIIVTYSYMDYFTGKGYEKCGFKFLSITKPNYYWFKGSKILSRYKTQKHKLSKLLDNYDCTLTEKENMINNGWKIYYGCGNTKWIKEKAQ